MSKPLLLLESPWAGITLLSTSKNKDGDLVDLVIEQINTTAQKQLDYLGIAEGKKYSQVFPLGPELLALYRTVLETRTPVEYQLCLPFEGKDIWWRNRCFMYNNDWLVVISENVTAVKKMEAEIQEKNNLLQAMNEELQAVNEELQSANEELQAQIEELKAKDKVILAYKEFERLLETLPQLVWTTNPYMTAGKSMYINHRWYAYTGMPADKDFNDIYRECVPVAQQAALEEHWQRCIATHEDFEREILLRRYDGEYRWHISKAIYTPDTNHWVGTFTDIHERKRAAQELSEKNKQLLLINTDLDNFIYTASHDLKSPIVNIEGLVIALTKRLTAKYSLDDEQNQILSMIAASINRLKATIGNLTEIAKIQKEDTPKEIISVSNLLEEVTTDLAKLMEDKQVVFHKKLAADKIALAPKNMRSIIYNLLSNAIKYHSPERPPVVVIETRREGNFMLMSVTDNGIGMAPQHVKKLFTMFKRFHTHVEGTGIGLYIVKRIVENAGGKIEVESTLNVGTKFNVYLPYTE